MKKKYLVSLIFLLNSLIKLNMSSQNPLDNAHISYQGHELEKYWEVFWLNKFLFTLDCISNTVQAPKSSAQKVID